MCTLLFLVLSSATIEGNLSGMSKVEVRAVYNDANTIFKQVVNVKPPEDSKLYLREATVWKLNMLFPNPNGIIVGSYNRTSHTIWVAIDSPGNRVCTLFHEIEHFLFHVAGLSKEMTNEEEHVLIHQMEEIYNPECNQEDGS